MASNSAIYEEEWALKAQEYLAKPQNWKEVCRVDYTDARVLNNPYFTEPTVQTTARDNAYTQQSITLTNDSVTISDIANLAVNIDRADLAQSRFLSQMEMAAKLATLLNEKIESAMLASHGDWTNFDNASIGGSAGNITVSTVNVPKIIRGIKRVIRTGNGHNLMQNNGVFIIWRPADFEMLEEYIQANGFGTADRALLNGTIAGLRYMGVDHYISNSHTSGHLFAGVKKAYHLGIVRSTYGQVVIDQEPATSSGPLSAIGVAMRIDYKFKAWNNTSGLLFDVLVS